MSVCCLKLLLSLLIVDCFVRGNGDGSEGVVLVLVLIGQGSSCFFRVPWTVFLPSIEAEDAHTVGIGEEGMIVGLVRKRKE